MCTFLNHPRPADAQEERTTLGGGGRGAVEAGERRELALALRALGRLARGQQLVHGHAAPQLRARHTNLGNTLACG